jgi:hypothetical protein
MMAEETVALAVAGRGNPQWLQDEHVRAVGVHQVATCLVMSFSEKSELHWILSRLILSNYRR